MLIATKASLSSLAYRVQGLDDELGELDARIKALLERLCPDLLDLFGVGSDTAAALVVCAWDNAERLHSEASWARMCGVAPIPTGSGQTSGRVRLNPAGDRQANAALWRIVMVRIAHDTETRAYFGRKLQEGRSKPEVVRLLKRYVARASIDTCPAAKTATRGLAHLITIALRADFPATRRPLIRNRSQRVAS